MKTARILIVIAVLVIIALVALYAFEATLAPASPSKSTTWGNAAGYPVQLGGVYGIAGQQCVNSTSYVYCVGGQDANGGPRNEVYTSSNVTPSTVNITGWTSDSNQYPQDINGQSCVASSGYIYCVGGTNDDGGDDVALSYFAPLGSDGVVGTWTQTTSFGVPIDSQSCVASSGYIYCVGGNNETDGSNADSVSSTSVYYAQLSSTGIGAWSSTTAYPGGVYFPTCYSSSGYIYCLGGADSNDNAVSTDFSAPLSSSGVGAWTQTTAYPVQASGQACGISSGRIYCVGGEEADGTYTGAAYSATVTSGEIGSWQSEAAYPTSVQTTCVISGAYMYCVGGFDSSSVGENNGVYYASLSSLSA
ncbi:MAG: hypothetical protein OK441_03300 [Thaumarchaeota archaeon]|nr:hypothetical protein [Nitrososphaerota archaeon]